MVLYIKIIEKLKERGEREKKLKKYIYLSKLKKKFWVIQHIYHINCGVIQGFPALRKAVTKNIVFFHVCWYSQSAADTPLAFGATRSGWWMNVFGGFGVSISLGWEWRSTTERFATGRFQPFTWKTPSVGKEKVNKWEFCKLKITSIFAFVNMIQRIFSS